MNTEKYRRRQPETMPAQCERDGWYDDHTQPQPTGDIERPHCEINSDAVKSPDDTSEPSSDTVKRPKTPLTCRQIIIIANVVTGNLLFSSIASMIVPFFPTEAERRRVPQTAVGAVFSAHAATMLVTAPLAGRVVPILGASRVYQFGLGLTGVATVVFGLMDRIAGMEAFVVACTAARVAEALGTAAAYTAGCTIIANQFPDRVNLLFALGETMVGVGMAVGPALGGVLFSAGGYGAPFYALGGLTVAVTVASWCSLPALGGTPKQGAGSSFLRRLVCSAEAWLNVAVVVTVSAGYTALRPGLAPFATDRLGVTPSQLGLYFLLAGGMYALTGPLVGKLCDHISNTYPVMSVFLALAAVGLALFCPPSPFGVAPTRTLLVLGMTLRELFLGGAMIPTFGNLLRAATAAGLPDSVVTQAFVSGVWAASFSVGSVLGPVFGGLLTDASGFPAAVDVFSALALLMALPVAVMGCSRWRRGTRSGVPGAGPSAGERGGEVAGKDGKGGDVDTEDAETSLDDAKDWTPLLTN